MNFDPTTLPEDWKVEPIRALTVRTSQRDPGKHPEQMFRYVDVSSVDNTLFKVRDVGELKGSDAPSRARKEIRENDVLFATVRPTLKRVALVPKDLDRQIASTGYCVLRADIKKCDPRFLYSYLLTDWFTAAMGRLERGASYPAVRDSDVFAEKIPVPPLPEQKKIAHILSMVQRAIEEQERIIQTTTELKKSLMQMLFTEGLRGEPQKETEIGLVPESWAVQAVEAFCAIKASGMTYRELEDAPDFPNGVRVLGVKVSDMNLPGNETEFISANLERRLPEAEAKKRTVPENAIVFPKRGAAIATNKKRLTTCWTVLDPNLIAVIPNELMNHKYFSHWFNTFDLAKITEPGPTPQLNKKDIAPLKFPMPSIEEQDEIVKAIDGVDAKLSLYERKKANLQAIFRTLLHELMTAKTRANRQGSHDIPYR